MANKLILTILLILFSSNAIQNPCKPRLIRLLIGDRYANMNSVFTATIMY